MTTTSATRPQHGRSATAPRLFPVVHYTVHSVRISFKNVAFVVFTIATLVLLYVLFNEVFGDQDSGGMNFASVYMVSMAAYGSMGAAMTGGSQLAA